jgi:hypothetical protein
MTEFYQFMKLPVFIVHYHQHLSENQSLNLLDFLDEHYGHGNVVDNDYEEDMKLPFKTCQQDFSLVQSIPQVAEIEFGQRLYFPINKISHFCYDTILINRSDEAIWQPPKDISV